jgi:glycosyltransferase involved in cell wall biosynthesis
MTIDSRPSLLVVQPSLQPPGGGNAVPSWLIQALRDDYRISLLALTPFDPEPVNRFFGTDLEVGDFEVHLCHRRLLRLLDALPVPLSLLKMSLLFRACRRLLAQRSYDVVCCTINEMDFNGVPGIQYVNFPSDYLPRPEVDMRWYHSGRLPLKLYRYVCKRIAGSNDDNIRRNLTLVNSSYVAGKMRSRYGIDPEILYPPVPGDFAPAAWEHKRNEFVAIGRISPEKDYLKLIDIVAEVRERGHDVELKIVGTEDDPGYYRKVVARARACAEFVRLRENLSRRELVDLVSQARFGIHGMVGEHFGIAVAELVRGGCVTFVPSLGGPVEIVGPHPALHYDSPADAVDKICRLLDAPEELERLHRAMMKRRSMFAIETFQLEVKKTFRDFLDRSGDQSWPPVESRVAS